MIFLVIALLLSLLANLYQWYVWHSYRSRPAGNHSWTGVMPVISADAVRADLRKLKGSS